MKIKNVFGRPEVDESTRPVTASEPTPVAPVRPQGKVEVAAVTAAIVHRDAGKTELAELQELFAATEAEYSHAVRHVDLKDSAALQKLGTLQIKRELLPLRIADREERDTTNEANLLATCNAFVTDTFGPRSRAVFARAEKISREKLAQHIVAEDALKLAVARADVVVQAQRIQFYAAVTATPAGGIDAHTVRLLEAWSQLEVLEKNLSENAA